MSLHTLEKLGLAGATGKRKIIEKGRLLDSLDLDTGFSALQKQKQLKREEQENQRRTKEKLA